MEEKLDSIRDIDKLNVGVTDYSFEEGLKEIIKELEKIDISTFSMNDNGKYIGHKEMLAKVIDYLYRCL